MEELSKTYPPIHSDHYEYLRSFSIIFYGVFARGLANRPCGKADTARVGKIKGKQP
jgi:hypothetical protein